MTVTVQIPAQEAPAEKPVVEQSTQAPSGQSSERPEWLPEKFQSPEALAEAYRNLEAQFTQSRQSTPAAPSVPTSDEQAGQELQARGLDMSEFQAEYSRDGKLSEASYTKLAQAGYDRNFVNDYIRGQEALATQESQAIFSEIGGEAEFQKIASWAKANLPAHEVEAFNRLVDSAPAETLRFAVLGLKAQYEAKRGSEPRLVNGQPGTSVEGFASKYEMVEAMRDPRYKRDDAYRAQVQAKLAATTAW